MTSADHRYMKQALALAERGLGRVWPNPAVGCVIVQGTRVVGRGWTHPGGRPHAETVALAQAGENARGATAYVTLEPCSHHGQTPPCTDALIAAGVTRVIIALQDPDPRVDGRGIARLRDAGIEVVTDFLRPDAMDQQQGFLRRVVQGRPMVTLKLATSLDGRIATATGESQWITGPEARRVVHMMRARHDAVLVGGGTARADDPSLTVRGLGVTHQPVRLVWSRRLDLPLSGKLAATAGEVPVWICHGQDADKGLCDVWAGLGATLIPVGSDRSRQIDPVAALQAIGALGLTRIFCEGGGALAASLLAADLVDELVVFSAGLALGAEGRPALGAMGIDSLSAAPRFVLRETQQVGADAMHRWRRAASGLGFL